MMRSHCRQLAQAAASSAAAQLDELPHQDTTATLTARAALGRLTGKAAVQFESLGAVHRVIAEVQDAVEHAQQGILPTLPAVEEPVCDTPSAAILREALEDARECITDGSTRDLLQQVRSELCVL
jgi:hypothetical protein